MFTPHPGPRTQPHRSIYHLEHDKENTTNRFPNKTPGRKPILLGGGAGGGLGGPSTVHGKSSHHAGTSSSSSMGNAPGTTGKQAPAGSGRAGTIGGKVPPKTVALERIGLSQSNANQVTGKKQNGGLMRKGKGNEKDAAGESEEIAPKLLFSKGPSISTQTPFKQAPLASAPTTTKKAQFAPAQTPANKVSSTAQIQALHTPLPSSTRRRKSRQSNASSASGGSGTGSTSTTPMKQSLFGPQTPFQTHASQSRRPSIGFGNATFLSPTSAAVNASYITPVRKSGYGFNQPHLSGQFSPIAFGHGSDIDEQDPDASFGSSGGASAHGTEGGMIRSSSGLEGLLEVNEDGEEMMEMLDMKGGAEVELDLNQMKEEDLEIEYAPPRGIPLPDLPLFYDEVTPLSEIVARFKDCPSNYDFVDPRDPHDISYGGWTMELLGTFDDELFEAGGFPGSDGDGKGGGSGMILKDEIELEDPRFREFAAMKTQRKERERAEADINAKAQVEAESQQHPQLFAGASVPSPDADRTHGHGTSSFQSTSRAKNIDDTKRSRKISLTRVLPSSEIPLSPIATPPIDSDKALKGKFANKVRAVQIARPSFPGRAGGDTGSGGTTVRNTKASTTGTGADKAALPAFRRTATRDTAPASSIGARKVMGGMMVDKARGHAGPLRANVTPSTRQPSTFPKPATLTPPSGNKMRANGIIRTVPTSGIGSKPVFVPSRNTSVLATGKQSPGVLARKTGAGPTIAGGVARTAGIGLDRPISAATVKGSRAGTGSVKPLTSTGPGRRAANGSTTPGSRKKEVSFGSEIVIGNKATGTQQQILQVDGETARNAGSAGITHDAQMDSLDLATGIELGLSNEEGFGGFDLTE